MPVILARGRQQPEDQESRPTLSFRKSEASLSYFEILTKKRNFKDKRKEKIEIGGGEWEYIQCTININLYENILCNTLLYTMNI